MQSVTSEGLDLRRLRPLLMLGAVMGVAWLVTVWVLQKSSSTLVIAGLCVVALAIIFVTLQDWRSGFFIFLVWLLFEDLARKYLGNNMVIYFGKDVLVLVTYFSFWTAYHRRRAESFRPSFLLALSLFFWLGVVQMFNPTSPSILYGLLGMKLYFYYVPLMFVGYALTRTEDDLRRLLVVNLLLAGVIALLGIMQSIVGPTFLNPEVLAPELVGLATLTRTAPISGEKLYRPTSVFVSDGRFAWYMILVWILGLGSSGYLLLRTRRGRKPVLFSLGLVAGGALLSGSRSTVMWFLGSALVMGYAMLWGAPWRWRQGHRLAKAIRRSFLLAGIGVFCLVFLFPQAVGARWAFYSETLLPESPKSELISRGWDYPIKQLELAFAHEKWVSGYGIGTTSLGVQYVSRFLGQLPPPWGVESGFGNLMIELGFLGPLLWLGWAVSLLYAGWRVLRRLKQTPHFPIAFAIYWYAFLLTIPFTFMSMVPYQNYVMNAYFWLLVGVFFRLPKLASQSPMEAMQPAGARQ